ncbi:MAG: hypothetical protein ABW166_09615 [Sedimenticola sp.]
MMGVLSPFFERHVLTGEFVPMKGSTPYAMVGNALLIAMMALLLAAGLIGRQQPTPERQ